MAYRITAGYKFPLASTDTPTDDPKANPPDITNLAAKLLRDGKAFSTTLNEFLDALKGL